MTVSESNIEADLQAQVLQSVSNASPLKIVGGDSKAFFGKTVEADVLSVAEHRGIIDYDPAELVITLRAGCRLEEVEALLAENNQMLGFEPPQLSSAATIGGLVATGLCGPRRAYSGAIRDFILGLKILNGRGEIVSFGGRVIKNVAGFDVSRLMVGALGTLGVILEVSLRVIPTFEKELTLGFEHTSAQAFIDWINELASKPLPLSASCWYRGKSYLRLSGSEQGVDSAALKLGGDVESPPWVDLREQEHEFFTDQPTLYRISVPSNCEDYLTDQNQLIEWGGAQRWINQELNLEKLREHTESRQGAVCHYRGCSSDVEMFHPLNDAMQTLHKSLKSSFDPARILNPGRFYASL